MSDYGRGWAPYTLSANSEREFNEKLRNLSPGERVEGGVSVRQATRRVPGPGSTMFRQTYEVWTVLVVRR